MSHETVQRYETVNPIGTAMRIGLNYVSLPVGRVMVSASDYDALRTQARALAEAVQLIIKIRNGAHELGALGKCTDMWKVAEAVSTQAQAAQLVWSPDKPTVAGGYWVKNEFETQVMMVRKAGDGFVVGAYKKPLEECDGWEFAGPLPMPREA